MTEAIRTDERYETATLDALLSDWHQWARGYRLVGQQAACPMFRSARSARGWENSSDVTESAVHNAQMEAVDFHVGELRDPHRSAIHAHARNLHSGRAVWSSPRLPTCPMERAVVLMEAKNQLSLRLMAAGVL